MNPYRTHNCNELRTCHANQEVRLAGWVAAKRDHGGLLFVDLRDPGGMAAGGVIQLVAHPAEPAGAVLERVRVESTISVVGTVVERSPENVNPKLVPRDVSRRTPREKSA